MSTWSLRWHFTKKSVTGAPYSTKSYSLSHSWKLDTMVKSTMTETVPWLFWIYRHYIHKLIYLSICLSVCLQVAAELQQQWSRTNKRRKSIPCSSSSNRKDSVCTQHAVIDRINVWLPCMTCSLETDRTSRPIVTACGLYIRTFTTI